MRRFIKSHFSEKGPFTFEPVSWSLVALFFLTTVFVSIYAARKCLRRSCFRNEESEPEGEYIDNTIVQMIPTVSAPKPPDDSIYNNEELPII